MSSGTKTDVSADSPNSLRIYRAVEFSCTLCKAPKLRLSIIAKMRGSCTFFSVVYCIYCCRFHRRCGCCWVERQHVVARWSNRMCVCASSSSFNRVDDIVINDLDDPMDMAANLTTGHLYVADRGDQCLWRVDVSGQQDKTLVRREGEGGGVIESRVPSHIAFRHWNGSGICCWLWWRVVGNQEQSRWTVRCYQSGRKWLRRHTSCNADIIWVFPRPSRKETSSVLSIGSGKS